MTWHTAYETMTTVHDHDQYCEFVIDNVSPADVNGTHSHTEVRYTTYSKVTTFHSYSLDSLWLLIRS